jgi:hypothetical protein
MVRLEKIQSKKIILWVMSKNDISTQIMNLNEIIKMSSVVS